jgi:DNA repair exonuclease SbcCD ATPase subunit
MKILGLYAENFKKLKAVTITPGEDNVIKITGGNGEGKSTVLEAIWAALGGKKYVPEVPVRTGEKKAVISLDLGDMIVTRKMTVNSEQLEVCNKDGAFFKSPQAMLDKLINGLSFKPLELLKMDKQKQIETLLSVTDIQVDDVKLKELSSYPGQFIAKNPLDKIKVAYDFVYKERTDVNRDLDKAKKILDSMPVVEKVDPVVITELVAEKERLSEENELNQEKRDEYSEQKDTVQDAKDNVERLEEELKNAKEYLAEQEEQLQTLKVVVDALQDNDLTEINNKIASADETNKKARQYDDRAKALDAVNDNQKDSDIKTAIIEKIKDYKQNLVSKAKFPIDGLDFGDNGILYNGLPFEQASSSQQLLVALSISAALHPDLKVITFDEGEKLDSKRWEIVEKFAKDNDLQVWATVVDTSGKMGIVIENGEIKEQTEVNNG